MSRAPPPWGGPLLRRGPRLLHCDSALRGPLRRSKAPEASLSRGIVLTRGGRAKAMGTSCLVELAGEGGQGSR